MRTFQGSVHKPAGRVCACAVLLTLAIPLFAAFPAPQKYVVDEAHVIEAAAKQQINALLRDVEEQTKAEIAVVTVASLDGMTVEDYANRLFKEWGIGKKGADNGVLVLVAPSERKMRIEVGYGLEPILPDGLAGQIIREQFTPEFRGGRYSAGIQAGVERIALIVRAKHVLTPGERKALDTSAEDRPPVWLMIPFFGVFIAVGGFMLGAGFGSKTFFPLVFGALFGGIPFLMSLIPFFNASPLILGPLALLAGVLGYKKGGPAFAESATSHSHRSHGGSTRSGGWSWGADVSSGSGSRSSSGSSSSGSFGGGSSGGGGASGSW